MTFQTAAWQQMGKMKHPVTEQIEKNMEQARYSIDMLAMLREKTELKISEDEKKFLDQVISELQLVFISESNKGEPSSSSGTEKTEEETVKDDPESKE
jgi:hypothetical protein